MDDKIFLLTVVGPTASGKTVLGVELAKLYNGEVISADSMQIYKGMDIATAKPSENEMHGIDHHLIGCIGRKKVFSVADYVNLARNIILDIDNRKKLPIIVGGTGLYISSLLDNIQFADIKSDSEIRSKLMKQSIDFGNRYLLNRLMEIDEKTASTLHENNLTRIIRALEVYELTGRKMSELKVESIQAESPYDYKIIGLTYNDRGILYDRINKRVDEMVKKGLVDECLCVYSKDMQCDDGKIIMTSDKAIGYKELIPYFQCNSSLEECIEKIKQETRRYAKRQLTWFRKNEKINWIMLDYFDTMEEILNECKKIIAK